MRIIKYKKHLRYSIASAAVVGAITIASLGQITQAATMDSTFVRFDRMKISTATTGTVCATPTTTSSDIKTWEVEFPTGYTVSSTAAQWQTANISTSNLAWPGSPTAWPNATSATASVSGQTVTWTNASAQTMTAGTMYCYNWTFAAVTVQSGAAPSNIGSITTKLTSTATNDTGQYATASIADDQIVVTATVPPAFSFALSGNTDALGTLSTGSISSSPVPRTATVNTNAQNGWKVWAKDSNTGLTSASAGYTIPANTYGGSPTTVVAGTEGYNTGVTSSQASGSGTLTVDPGFLSGGAGQGGGLTTALRSIATSTGTANTAVLTLTNNVAINGATPAATDYTDTLTVVGAGLF